VAAPSEQHTLGLYLLGEFLRRGGWDTLVEPTMPDAELVTLVESEYVELIGISVSSEDLLEAVGRLVGTLKRASRNPDLAVLLGGSIDLAEHAARLGASSFSDPRDVVRWLNGCSNKG
jgi:MerR family transcriptional regulator, light-induced transcriptional regulator